MLRDVGKAGVGGWEPGGVEDDPVDDCDQERVCGDGGVEEGVQRLQRAREVREEGGAVARVGEGVEGGEEEVECQAPVGEDCEVGEGEGGGFGAAVGGLDAGEDEVEE